MMYYIKYVKVVLILSITVWLTAAFSASPKKDDRALLYFAGGDILYSRRIESHPFEPIEKRQDIIRQNLFHYGFNIGKRYYAAPWLRFQLEGMFHFGKCVEEDTITDIYSDPHQKFFSLFLFKHIGLNLDIHLVRQITNRLSPFVLLGGGLNYMHMEERTVLPDDPSQEILVNYAAANVKRWSPSLNLGAGFDSRLTRQIGLSVAYAYCLWKPVKYLDASDMPLKPIEHEERFYTHRFQVKFLFSLGGE